jgi:hypothetical protein
MEKKSFAKLFNDYAYKHFQISTPESIIQRKYSYTMQILFTVLPSYKRKFFFFLYETVPTQRNQ